MNVTRRVIWFLVMVIAFLAGMFLDPTIRRRVGLPIRLTSLEFQLRGGFAYVNSPADHTFEVAYLKETNVEGCYVKQPGTDLNVIRGTITEPASNPAGNRTFDVGGAVITIEGTMPAAGPIAATPSHPPAPKQPADTGSDIDWADVTWIPHVSPDYQTSTLNPNWRSIVDGRLVLTGGHLTGDAPSKVMARDKLWEWRTPAGDATYQQAITDTATYTATIWGDQVALTLTGARSGVTRIVVKPANAGDPVVLQLNGRHDTSDPPPQVGEPIHHFCAFYQLMQTVPPLTKQYLPYLLGDAQAPGGGRGSPGYYCPGDFF